MQLPMRSYPTSTTWLVVPIPTLSFALLAGLVQLFLIKGLLSFMDLDQTVTAVIAGQVVASICIYATLLVLLARGDPRLWRDRARFADSLAPDRPFDPAADELARALVWREASVTMGRQCGCLAGLVAASSLALTSRIAAVVVFVLVALTVWLSVSMLVSRPDRPELGPLIPDHM